MIKSCHFLSTFDLNFFPCNKINKCDYNNQIYINSDSASFGLLKGNSGLKKEGMDNNSDDSNKTTEVKKNEDLKKTIQKINQNATSNQGLVMTPIPQTDSAINNTNESNTNSGDESFEVGRSKKNSQGYNIDYASTVEDAYDELNKILGSDGIKRLTSDTQNLMKQQLQLAESMKSMQPLIAGMAPIMEQAKGLLGNLGDTGNLGNLSKIAEKFSSGLGNNGPK